MKALQRLAYTINNKHTPNQKDAEALNDVIKYYNTERRELYNNQTLFAKLVISVLKNDIIRNGGNYQVVVESLKSVCRINLEASMGSMITEINQLDIEKHIELYKGDLEKFVYPRYNEVKMKDRVKDIITNLLEDYSHLN